MRSSSSNYCHVCGILFSLTNSKKNCTSCQLPVCKDHSKNGPLSICDFCHKENLIKNCQFSNKELREQLQNELAELRKDKQNEKSLMHDQGGKIKCAQGNLKNLIDKLKNIQAIYEEKLKKENERNAIFNVTLINIKNSNDEMIIAENTLKIKIDEFDTKISETTSKIESAKQEKCNLENKLKELKEKSDKYIPLKLIKTKLCKLCLHKIDYLYRSTRENTHSQENIIINKPCTCNVI